MRKLYLSCLFIAIVSPNIFSQSIRKNYLEMSPTEMTDYKAALQLLWSSGSTAFGKHMYFANAHGAHFNENIHSFSSTLKGVNFTSFHRYFLLQWEQALQATSPNYNYLTIPYWDWRVDPDKSLSTLTPQNSPNFILFSLLSKSDFVSWGLTRAPGFSGSSSLLPNSSAISTVLSMTDFWVEPVSTQGNNSFSINLERQHNTPHVWVGGNMNSGISPKDPVFYSHHAMIDKLWNDWEEKTSGIQSVFPAAASPIPHYGTASGWIENLSPDSCADSRYIKFRTSTTMPANTKYDVWYAENGSVILDGSNGTNFVVKSTKTYRYGAWNRTSNTMEGVMYVGDMARSGANIVADNKGGFVVEAGAVCDFHAGKEISFEPGTSLKSGSTVNAKIVYP